MFTGIVRERGRIVGVERNGTGMRLRISAPETAAGTGIGDSVSVSGCCLTAVAVGDGELAFDAVGETLSRTNLAGLKAGAEVNLEPALRAGDSLGGHYVQGHVDGVARVRAHRRDGEGSRLWLDLSPKGFKVLSRASPFSSQESWTLPVISRGLMYLRQNGSDLINGKPPRLICFDMRAEK